MFNLKSSEQTQNYIKDGIAYICENFRNRSAGSKSENDAQQYMKSELEAYSDGVLSEKFEFHPMGYSGLTFVAATISLISVILYWAIPYNGSISRAGEFVVLAIAPILMLACILLFLIEAVFYGECVDFIFPKKTSENIYAVRKPSGETKRRIIFSANADAAHELTFKRFSKPLISVAVVGMFMIFVITLARFFRAFSLGFVPVIGDGVWKTLGIIMLVFTPFIISMYFLVNYKKVSDGVSDNLSGCYTAMCVLKEMSDNNLRFANTEVGCLITGAKQAGLRGAKAFSKAHIDEFNDVETVIISADKFCDANNLQIFTGGRMGSTKASEAIGAMLREAGIINSTDLKKVESIYTSSDCEAFSKYGIKSCAFRAVNSKPTANSDLVDNINSDCIRLSLDICLEAAGLYDEKNGIKRFEASGMKAKK